jgi:catecholate siderophore receptor
LSSAVNNANNPNMDPQKTKTFEVGAKWDALQEKLSLNVAVFRTDVTNEINSLIVDDAGNATQTGEKRVEGIELSAIGNITEKWQITAGYTNMDTEVEEGPLLTADGTPNLTYTPDEAFTSWTTYRFPFGLTVGGGASYTAGLHRGTDGARGTPAFTDSYVVYNAVISYDINDYIALRLNAYNLTDKEYVASINKSGYRYTPGAPRTFLLSADFRF